MKPRFLTGLLSLLMPAMVLAGEYDLTVDRVKIDTGDFVKEGIGYNGASPGPVMRFKAVSYTHLTLPTILRV